MGRSGLRAPCPSTARRPRRSVVPEVLYAVEPTGRSGSRWWPDRRRDGRRASCGTGCGPGSWPTVPPTESAIRPPGRRPRSAAPTIAPTAPRIRRSRPMVAEAVAAIDARRGGQGGTGPPGGRAPWTPIDIAGAAPPLAPARAELPRLLDARRRRPVRRGQPRAAGGAGGPPGAQPSAGRHHRPVPEAGGVLPRELLTSAKDSAEHRLVVDAIGQALAPLLAARGARASGPGPPAQHHPPREPRSTGHLAPAAGPAGCRPPWSWRRPSIPPRRSAACPGSGPCALIARLEPGPRGHYAGPVGYVDGRGDGRWVLGIRAVTVAGPDARLAAGVGRRRGLGARGPSGSRPTSSSTAVFDALAPGVPFSTTGAPAAHRAVG